MALKGTLKDFSIADIFQLIGQQGKSGSLFIKNKEKEAHIVFDQGKIVLGTFKKSDEDFLLGTMLLRSGVITAEQLTKAIENQKTSLRSIGDILKSMEAVTAPLLGEFVNLQLKEVLFRIFQWKDGLYEFVAEKIQYNKAIIKPQTAEAVLMDGFRMLDEWPAIVEKVGSGESVFRSLVNVNEISSPSSRSNFDDQLNDAFSGFDGDSPSVKPTKEDEGPSEDERKILLLLDGNRSLQEIVYRSRLGTFDTFKAISQLVNRSMAEKITELMPTRMSSLLPTVRVLTLTEWLASSLKTLLAVFTVAALVPFLAFGVKSQWSDRYMNSQQVVTYEKTLSFVDIREIESREQLIQMLEMFHLQNGTYPYSLDDLQDSKLNDQWDYRQEEKRYTLRLRILTP